MNTHDYSKTEWGHDYSVLENKSDGLSLRLAGWGAGLSENDYIILKNGEETTRYQINDIEYEGNPIDMWFASVSFAPRG